MIAAVVVTYNRKELLVRNIESLLRQSRPVDRIIVVDNCSTDGTYEKLTAMEWYDPLFIQYSKTETNIGGAGGFSEGTRIAYDAGADWIVLMDDDGYCTDNTTVEKLVEAAELLKTKEEYCGRLFVNALVHQGELLSFKINDMYTVEEAKAASENNLLMNAANPFNGTVVSRELVKEIGYPNRDFFIKGDEVDYKSRAYQAGACVVTVCSAMYTHPRPDTREKSILGKKVPFFVEAPWKEYYAARNFTYMYKNRGWYKAIAFELIFVKMLAIMCMRCKKFATLRMVLKGVTDGWRDRLGPIVKP